MINHYSNFDIPLLKSVLEQPAEPGPAGLSTQTSPAGVAQDDGPAVGQWTVTEEQAELARATFLAGGSVGDAARVSGMAWSTARRLLAEEIKTTGRPMVTWNQMTQDQVEEAAQLRAEGWSYETIAERYGVTRQAVTRRLKAHLDRLDPDD